MAGLLDKDGASRESTAMNTAIPIESAKPVAAAKLPHVGVLLVNLGTPDTADARGVRVYLKEFLSDPRVIENQGLVWKLILNGIILRVRPGRKARDYRKIWNTEKNESPLKTITRSPIILKELLTIGEDLRKGTRSIKEIVQFDDEELTEEKIAKLRKGDELQDFFEAFEASAK